MDRALPRVVLLANWDWVLYNFRLPLARALEKQGLEVILVCPPGKYTDLMKEQGFHWIPWKLDRRNTAVWGELSSIIALIGLYRSLQPIAVAHHFTIKPVLYGSIASRFSRISQVINNFTGLGFLFTQAPLASRLRWIISPLLKIALRGSNMHTAFQSEADRHRLEVLGIVDEKTASVIPGTGVDLKRFYFDLEEKRNKQVPVVLMASRLLWDKGVREFVEAAQIIRSAGLEVRFLLAGEPDLGNPACIPEDILIEWREEGVVEFLGHHDDMPELLRQADIAVLPSYHEGVPLFLLEAAASSLPLVGTDIEGCRMVIRPEVNGLLVPVRDSEALADALMALLNDPGLRLRMGQESRRIASENFSQSAINEQYVDLYRKLGILS